MGEIFTPAEHRQHHQRLHTALLELLHDYLVARGTQPGVLPEHPLLRDPISVLLDWSTRQIHQPSPGAHIEVPTEAAATEARLDEAIQRYQQVPHAPVSRVKRLTLPTTPESTAPLQAGSIRDWHPPERYEQVARPEDYYRVGERVWWLRKVDGGRRPQMPLAAEIVEQTAGRVKVRGAMADGRPFLTWVSRTRLRKQNTGGEYGDTEP